MKTKLSIIFTLLFVLTNTYSQNKENPFHKLGYDVLVATSSKGEFEEFHDQKDIVEIGSILYDTKAKKIVKILDEGESTIEISSATAAMSIDPLCEKYYWISPYVYALNNPLRFVDPDGRLARDSVGNIIYEPTNRVDTDQNRRVVPFGDGRNITLNYQYVTIYADDGTPIEVQQVTGATYLNSKGETVNLKGNSVLQGQLGVDIMSNCHGLAFADGQFIMDDNAVSSVLKGDNYVQINDPLSADVGLVRQTEAAMNNEGFWFHSARADGGYGTFRDKNDIGKIRTGVPYHQIKNFNKRGDTQVTTYFVKRPRGKN